MGGLIPLGDASRRPRTFAYVTTLIIVINVYVFLQELTYGNAFVWTWSAVPIRIIHGHRIITLLTSMFMHAGWMHIIGNMIYLWAFGREIEDAMGPVRYLLFYIVGGIFAMSAQILGASGAIAAVMGAFIVTFPRDRIRTVLFFFIFFRVAFIPAAFLIGFWFLIQLFNFGAVAQVRTGGVAYLAHIGGFLFGVITGRLLADPRRIASPTSSY
jgi:membrane associated rhomboid family serine protease